MDAGCGGQYQKRSHISRNETKQFFSHTGITEKYLFRTKINNGASKLLKRIIVKHQC